MLLRPHDSLRTYFLKGKNWTVSTIAAQRRMNKTKGLGKEILDGIVYEDHLSLTLRLPPRLNCQMVEPVETPAPEPPVPK